MKIFPAIDIKDKKCVRLFKGNFDEKKVYEPKVICDDANNLLKYVKKESVDLAITSPPYWNILNQKRTADFKEIRNYSKSKKDLGNFEIG